MLQKAEYCQIERHRKWLSECRGYNVDFEDARDDWLENHAEDWRMERQSRMLALQRDEIQRYKWIESEKAQRDLGRDAVLDWINRYAAQWRSWFEKEYEESEV